VQRYIIVGSAVYRYWAAVASHSCTFARLFGSSPLGRRP